MTYFLGVCYTPPHVAVDLLSASRVFFLEDVDDASEVALEDFLYEDDAGLVVAPTLSIIRSLLKKTPGKCTMLEKRASGVVVFGPPHELAPYTQLADAVAVSKDRYDRRAFEKPEAVGADFAKLLTPPISTQVLRPATTPVDDLMKQFVGQLRGVVAACAEDPKLPRLLENLLGLVGKDYSAKGAKPETRKAVNEYAKSAAGRAIIVTYCRYKEGAKFQEIASTLPELVIDDWTVLNEHIDLLNLPGPTPRTQK